MKKQFLFLTMFTLALIFAGMSSYGQLSDGSPDVDYLDAIPSYCTPAVEIDCGNGLDALAPVPGTSYAYTVTSPTTTGAVHWFVTDDAQLMDAQASIVAGIEPSNGTSPYILTADAAYNDVANTSKTVNITWKSFDGNANAVILVVYNVDDANCTDNMEVYRIIPQYNFTLDVASISDDGATGGDVTPVQDCVNPIQAASYDGGTNTLTVDYGTDYVFFAVNAANWVTSWMPDNFSAVSDLAGSTPVVTGWAYPDEATTGGTWHAIGDPLDFVDASHPAYVNDGLSNNGFVGSDGACIIVRVQVDHGTTTENIVNETITLTVNGEMYNAVTSTFDGTYPDLDEDINNGGCIADDTSDAADYIITPRPDIEEDTPSPFETKVPDGNVTP
jgi:hypothetical protein